MTRYLVDAATDLPIRLDSTERHAGQPTRLIRTEFAFDQPIPDEVFRPAFEPEVDLVARWAELVAKWKTSAVAEGRKARVVDAQVAKDGSLYLLYTGTWRPVAARAGATKYVFAARYDAGGVQGDTEVRRAMKALGTPLHGIVLVPTELSPPRPDSVEVDFKDAPTDLGTWDRAEPDPASPVETLSVPTRPCDDWPDYAFDLVLSQDLLHRDVQRASAQAAALGAKGDVDGAVKMYREASRRKYENGPASYKAYQQLVPAEKLLRAAGRKAEADALKAEIEAAARVGP